MTTVTDILTYLESLAPMDLKMDWDNVGLLCGRGAQEVTKVLVALDPFESVCYEAAALDCQLIVTHHPLIFQPVKAITDDTSLGRSILFLAQQNISAINAHTNLDCAPGGVNDVLAERLGLANIRIIGEENLLRQGQVDAQPLEEFLRLVQQSLGCPGLKYTDGGKPVSRVAVGGGACGGELYAAVQAGCDTFVTADVKYNQFWEAQALGLNLIDAGHFYTENPVCGVLARKLQAQFPEITVVESQNHIDCAKFFR